MAITKKFGQLLEVHWNISDLSDKDKGKDSTWMCIKEGYPKYSNGRHRGDMKVTWRLRSSQEWVMMALCIMT